MSAKKVLLVEDHAHTSTMLKNALVQEGFDVFAYPSVEAATADESRYKRPDLVILDVHLPGRRGDEYGVELRTRYQRLPIIIMTADQDLKSIQKLLPDAEIVTKPIDVEKLFKAVMF